MNRDWMYHRYTSDSYISREFDEVVESFIEFAIVQLAFMDRNFIRCHCWKCNNQAYCDVVTVRIHLPTNGFVFNYHVWSYQGEHPHAVGNKRPDVGSSSSSAGGHYRQMIFDVAGPTFNMDYHHHNDDEDMEDVEEPPNPETQRFFDMLRAADNELWPSCKSHSQLSLVARMINLKSENNISEKYFDGFVGLMKDIVPDNNLVPDNFYKTKKLLRGMGMPLEKIDCCFHNCMLYWKGDSELEHCRICRYPRFKTTYRMRVAIKMMYYFPLTPRLQRLYASAVIAKHMWSHASSVDDEIMRHPADSPAWKHLNNAFPNFAAEPRNVRLGLSTDGFQPFGQTGKQFSSWPVILTPYNFPALDVYEGSIHVPDGVGSRAAESKRKVGCLFAAAYCRVVSHVGCRCSFL